MTVLIKVKKPQVVSINGYTSITRWCGNIITQGIGSNSTMKELRPGTKLEEGSVVTSENYLEIEVQALERMFSRHH